MKFDKKFIKEIVDAPITNANQLAIVEAALQKAIDERLSPKGRDAVIRVCYKNQKQKQKVIAAELGVNPSTICRNLKHAKNQLRKCFAFYADYLNYSSEEE